MNNIDSHEQELSLGEKTILEYVISQISERLLDILRLKVTYKALELAKNIEFEKLEQ